VVAVENPIVYNPVEGLCMRINSIEVRNFRGFEHLYVEFPSGPVTVLIGDNGAGKTSLIDALALGLGGFLSGIPSIRANSIKKSDVRMQTIPIGSVIDRQAQYPVEIKCTGDIGEHTDIRWVRSLHSEQGRTTKKEAKAIIDIAASLAKRVRAGDTQVILPLVSYYGTGRIWAQKREKSPLSKPSRLLGYMDCLDIKANDKLLVNWLRMMTYQEHRLGAKIPELEAVLDAVSSCVYGSLGCERSSVRCDFDLMRDELCIQYTSPSGQLHKHPVHELSEGFKNTISLVADIAYRMAKLNPQLLGAVLETPGIVLIDEIDQHLHPKWQQNILEDLVRIFPKVQFIVSSHSPFVLGSAPAGSVVQLEPGMAKVTENLYGSDVNTATVFAMGSPLRNSKVQRLYDQFYSCLDRQEFSKAKEILEILRSTVSNQDPEFVAATINLKMETDEMEPSDDLH
jgi:predicted ATP-binding protein involved in virulence